MEDNDLENAKCLLDVGSGDGYTAFQALLQMDSSGQVIFTDQSERLVAHCRMKAISLGLKRHSSFHVTRAETLDGVGDSVADAVNDKNSPSIR